MVQVIHAGTVRKHLGRNLSGNYFARRNFEFTHRLQVAWDKFHKYKQSHSVSSQSFLQAYVGSCPPLVFPLSWPPSLLLLRPWSMAPLWHLATAFLQCWSSLLNRAAPALAQLPSTCREALTHTALVCTGTPPTYYPPGWGPCSLCWGWFLPGCCCGIIACCLTHTLVCSAAARATPPAPSVEYPDVVDSGARTARLCCGRRDARTAPSSDRHWQHSRGAFVSPPPRTDFVCPATDQRNSEHSDAHDAAPFRYFAAVATTPTTTATDVAVAPIPSDTRRCPSVTTRLGKRVCAVSGGGRDGTNTKQQGDRPITLATNKLAKDT